MRSIDDGNPVGRFVIRNGLTGIAAAKILGYSRFSISTWGVGERLAPPKVLNHIAALDALADAGLPWPGAIQPDRRQEPRFPVFQRRKVG